MKYRRYAGTFFPDKAEEICLEMFEPFIRKILLYLRVG